MSAVVRGQRSDRDDSHALVAVVSVAKTDNDPKHRGLADPARVYPLCELEQARGRLVDHAGSQLHLERPQRPSADSTIASTSKPVLSRY